MSAHATCRRLGWGTVTAAVITALMPPLAAAAGPATPAGLRSSEPNATTSVLSWSEAARAVRYDVQVDNDSTFGSPEFTTRTTNTTVVPTDPVAGGTNHWRVRSVDSSGATSGWIKDTFSAPAVGIPVPVSPLPDAVLKQPASPPLLVWDGAQGAMSYTVEVDGDEDFVGATSYQTETTSLVIPDPLEAGDWYWRVVATRGAGIVSKPSTESRFVIEALPAPELVSPSNSATEQVEDVVLDWKSVPGAKSYKVEIALNDTFTTIVHTRDGILGTRYSPPEGLNNDQYYWRVSAIDLAGQQTPWAESQFNFQRHWPDRPWPVFPVQDGFPTEADSANHDPSNYPIKRVTTSAPYLQWTPVQHASHYQLEIDTQQNFSSSDLEVCRIAGTTYTPGNGVFRSTSFTRNLDEQCVVDEGVRLYWRVRPMDKPFRDTGFADGIEGIYSPTQSFVWDPEYFTDLSPVGGAEVDVPTLSWTPTMPAEKFEIEIFKQGSSFPFHRATTYATSYTPVGVELRPEDGPFTWQLSAIEAGGVQSALVRNTFTVSGALPSSGVSSLTALSGRATDPATDRAPALTWEPMPGADYYRIHLGDSGTGFFWLPGTDESFGKELHYPAFTETGKRLLKPGWYDWYVEAFDANHVRLGTSELNTFRVSGFPDVTGQRIALDGKTLDDGGGCSVRLDDGAVCEGVPATPVLSWDHQPGMSSYVVYVSQDANFTNLTETTRIPNTSNTRYAFTFSNNNPALPDNESGVPYYWHIRPCKAIGICGPDPVSSATSRAENAFVKQSPKVQLTQPAAGTEVTTNEVTFDWDDYFDTNQATAWQTESSPQSAKWYRVQVDDSTSFASPLVDDIRVDQSTYTAFTKLYPEGTLHWRVAAIDGADNELNWSAPRSFVKKSPQVSLTSPVGGQEVPGTTAFRWQSQAFADSYRIEVYKNNDTTFSTANRVFYKDVETAAYAWNSPLPPSSEPYIWRVRRTDAYRNPGPWSLTGRFYSTGVAPMRVEPAADAAVEGDRALFQWTEVPGAVDYQVEVREEGSTYSRYRETTVATAWAPTSSISQGRWQWRVIARDADRNNVGNSGWGNFTVPAPVVPDTTRPTVTSYSPIYSAKRRSNVKIVFNEAVKRDSVTKRSFFVKKQGSRRKLAGRLTVSRDATKAVFNPKRRLRGGKIYQVVVNKRIRDRAGNRLVTKKWTFTVR